MNDQNPLNDQNPSSTVPEKGSGVKTFALLAALAALLAGNIYLFQKVDHLTNETSQWQTSMVAEITAMRDAHTTIVAEQNHRLDLLNEQLGNAAKTTARSRNEARKEAQKAAERLEQLSAEQQQRQSELAAELTGVKEVASAANTKIADVSADVGTVKTEVATTRSELDKTASDLKRMTGDMGIMSGLIATNGKELAALKELGERNYFEFNLAKGKTPQKVGDIRLLAKKTDTKRNKFTIEIHADDKRVEKRDRTINEPVQFYVSGGRQPYEIVVNQVSPNRLIGYMATPKIQFARK